MVEMKEPEVNEWLRDHVEYLGELLDLDLSLWDYRGVKGGRPDVIAEEKENLVVFENQLRRADKRHLGQILYYLYVSKKIKTGVWIAPSFSDNLLSVLGNINKGISKNLLGVEMTIKQSPRRLLLKMVNGEKNDIVIRGGNLYKMERRIWDTLVVFYGL